MTKKNLEIFLEAYVDGKEVEIVEENNIKPQGHWKNWNNIESELKRIIKQQRKFPTSTYLRENGHASLYQGIKQYHGGIEEVRQKLGYETNKKTVGYWSNWENVENELNQIIKKVKHFPTQSELLQLGKSSLGAAIGKHHGGLLSVKEKMGYDAGKKSGYWKDFGNVKDELEKIIEKTGEFPTQTYLTRNGYASLNSGMRHHGGLTRVRKKLGYKELVKPKGYWQEWKHVEKTLKKMIRELGHFPKSIDFKDSKYSSIPNAIKEFHGGMDKVMERMRYERESTPMGYWKDFDNVSKIISELEEKLQHFPSATEMHNAGYSSLPSAVQKYHGGLHTVAEKLGKKTQLREAGYWTLKRTKEKCLEFMTELGYFPTQQDLKKRYDHYQGLNVGVKKHGGFARLKRLLKITEKKKPSGYWDEKTTLQEAKKIYNDLGYWPKQKELCEMGRNDLVAALSKYIGVAELRKKFGLKVIRVADGHWTEETILNECRNIVNKNGDLPTKSGLGELGRSDLAAQIERNGGYYYFREKLGLSGRKKQYKFWTKENTYAEANKLYEALGHFPTEDELSKHKISTLAEAAREHFGGMRDLRKLVLEAHDDYDEDPQLKDLKYIQDQLKKIKEENDMNLFPGQMTLKKLGYSDLISAIKRYHGGLNAVRESLGEKPVAKNGTWNPDYVLTEVIRIMNENNWEDWPGEKALRKIGYTMIPEAIRKCYGSTQAFREVLDEHVGKGKKLESS